VQAQAGLAEGAAWLTRERHQQAVREASAKVAEALRRCIQGTRNEERGGGDSQAELVAQELREAAAAIGSITGRTTSEDVLDVVFSTFCIGK